MNIRGVLGFLLIVWVLVVPAALSFAADSACVTCHTNDATLKSLYKPPAAGAAEEGEG